MTSSILRSTPGSRQPAAPLRKQRQAAERSHFLSAAAAGRAQKQRGQAFWLPAEFAVDGAGKVSIVSEINNLDRFDPNSLSAKLYGACSWLLCRAEVPSIGFGTDDLATVFEAMLPQFEFVLDKPLRPGVTVRFHSLLCSRIGLLRFALDRCRARTRLLR